MSVQQEPRNRDARAITEATIREANIEPSARPSGQDNALEPGTVTVGMTVQNALELLRKGEALLRLTDDGHLILLMPDGRRFAITGTGDLSQALREHVPDLPLALNQHHGFAIEVLERFADTTLNSGAWRHSVDAFARTARNPQPVSLPESAGTGFQPATTEAIVAPRPPESQTLGTVPLGLPQEGVGGVFIASGQDAVGLVSASGRDFVGLVEHKSFVKTVGVGTNLAHLPGLPDEDPTLLFGWQRPDEVASVRRDPIGTTLGPAPQAADDAFTRPEDVRISGNVIENDANVSGASVRLETPPPVGTLDLRPDGTFDYDPPPHFAGEVRFTYRVTDTNGRSSESEVVLTIVPVADAPLITAPPLTVPEDTALAFGASLGIALVDTDGSERLVGVVIGGVPVGALVTYVAAPGASVVLTSGQYSITGSEAGIRATLASFALTPPAQSDTDITLTLAATTEDSNGDTATRTVTQAITVVAVTDTPTVAAGGPYTTNEDTPVLLTGLTGALVDTDGSETLSFRITGVPAGCSFTSGTSLGGGIWSFTPAEIAAGVTFVPQAQLSGTVPMVLEAIADETRDDGAVTASAPFSVTLQPVTDTPALVAGSSSIMEDGVVPLGANITLSHADTDGSETLAIVFSGIPATAMVSGTVSGSASLVSLGGGSYRLQGPAADALASLPSVTVTPAAHDAVDFTVGVSVTARETATGITSIVTGSHPVTITAVADQPTLAVGAGTFSTNEDTPILLTGLAGALVDTDGSETLLFTISNVATGASFDRGTNLGGGVWRFTPADIAAGLTFTPPLNARADFVMTLTATTTEAENGSTAFRALSFTVSIDGVADPATIVSAGSSGNEDSVIAIGTQVSIALQDTDGSESVSQIEIRGVPTGATLGWNTGLPGTVQDMGGGTWRFTAASETDLRALFNSSTLQPPLHSDSTIPLTIAVTTREATGSTRETTAAHAVSITAVADAPTITGGTSSTGNEDTSITFGNAILYALVDADGSERVSSVALSSFPVGSTVNWTVSGTASVTNVAGVYTISGPNAADIRTTLNSFRVTPPLHSDVDFAITTAVTTTDTGGVTATTTGAHLIVVNAVADAPSVPVTTSTGNEDTAILVGPQMSYALVDTDGTEVISSVAIGNVPVGGTLQVTAAGAATVTTVAGVTTITGTPADIRATLDSARVTPPLHSDVDFALSLAVTTTDTGGVTATTNATHNVVVNAVADAPTITGGTSSTGNEDTSITFGNGILYALVDADGSERVSSVALSSFPVGSTVNWTVSGTASVTNVAGVYTISGPNAADIRTTLNSFRVTPPLHSDVDFAITTAVTTTDTGGVTATTTGSHLIVVNAVADQPNNPNRSITGNEDTFITVGTNITYSLVDADGSEVISSVRISGVPAGSTVNYTAQGAASVAVTGTGPFTYTVTGPQADIRATLNTWQLRPPTNSDVDFTLTVRVTAQDTGGVTAFRDSTHTVTVTAVADQPTVTVPGTPYTTNEDTAVTLTGLGGALTDTDSSETLSFRISGVPTGASFNVGTNLGGGVWSFTPAQITAGPVFTPPSNLHGSIGMTLQSISTEAIGGSTANNSAPFTVNVTAVADTPTAAGGASTVNEDTFVTFGNQITYALVDADGSESISSVALSSFPVGASVTYTLQGAASVSLVAGVYTITGPQADIRSTLNTFAVRAPQHSDVDFSIAVAVTSTDAGGVTATHNVSHAVTVNAVVDAPTVGTGAPITTAEDTPVAVAGLAGALVDTDGSETLSFRITGVPTGSSFDRGTNLGGGIWSFSPADITAGVNWSPPAQASGTFTMTLQATATETSTGQTATTSSPFDIIVTPVIDAPVLNSGTTTVNEDQSIPLGSAIDLTLADVDGSQTMVITLSGVPGIVSLSATPSGGAVFTNVGGGVYTISGPAAAVLTTLDTVTASEPTHRDLNFTVSVDVTTTETATGATASASGTHAVTVRAVADQPTISGSATANEDTTAAIPITVNLVDLDGSERLQSVTVSGVPTGATLNWNIGLPGTVTNQGGGSFLFQGSTSEIQTLLQSLTLVPPTHRGTDITLTVTAVSEEFNPTEGGDVAVLTASRTTNVVIDMVPVADQPTVSVPGSPFTVEEDTFVLLNGLGGALVDTDGSETLRFQISSVPSGATFNAGTSLGGGVWEFTPAQLATLQFRGPTNRSGTYDMTLTAMARETENGSQATNAATFRVIVDDQADPPNLTGSTTGNEDSVIAFGLDVGVALRDTDGSEQLTSIFIESIPAGTTINYTAVGGASVVFAAGRYTITGSTADMQATLDTFTITPAANDDTNLSVVIGATTLDADGTVNSGTRTHPITVRAVADAPVSAANDVSGWEDQSIALSLSAALTDPTQESLSARIILSSASMVLTANTAGGGSLVNAGGGIWTVTAPSTAQLNAILGSVSLTAPQHYSGVVTGTLEITATEAATGGEVAVATAITTDTFSVTVGADADMPNASAPPATGARAGYEDQPIRLDIAASLVDADGSEVLSYRITNVPTGARFVNGSGVTIGTDEGGGSFRFTAAEIAVLRIIAPLHSSDDFTLQVHVTSTEVTPGLPGNGDSATRTFALPVQVIGVADAPLLTVNPIISPEDQPIPLGANISATLVDTDGSEVLYYVIVGLPAGVNPSVGTYIGGEWQIAAADIGLLTIPAPANFSGNYTATYAPSLSVRAVTQENDGHQTATTLPLQVTITPVTDAFPGWSPGVTVTEDNVIPLSSIGSGFTLADNDGSEVVVSYTLDLNGLIAAAGIGATVPSVASFIANQINGTFTNNGNGTITVLPANIGGISFKAAPFRDSNVDFSIPITAAVREVAGSTVTVNGTFSVNLVGDADVPTVFAGNVSGLAGSHIQINPTGTEFGGVRTDTDAALGRADSERLYYIVSGLDSTPGLNFAFYNASNQLVGLDNGDGTWFLEPADLVGLKIRSAAGQSGTATLSLTSVVVENDGDIATSAITQQFNVTVIPDPGSSGTQPLPPIVTILPASGNEDTNITFRVTASPDPADPSPSPPTVTVLFSNIPPGARIVGATYNPTTQRYIATEADVNNNLVYIVPPANYSGPLNVTVEAVASNVDLLRATTGLLTMTVDVIPVADGVNISANPTAAIEDTPVSLNLNLGLRDTNGTQFETLVDPVRITLTGGATLSAGTHLGGGVYQVALSDVPGLQVIPANNRHGAVSVLVEATSREPANGATQTSTSTINLNFTAVGDQPNVTVANSSGNEDALIALAGLSAALADTDGSEVLSVKLIGVPEGSLLSHGANNGDGTWTINPAQLPLLSLRPPMHYSGTINLTLEAYALDTSGSVGTTSVPFSVTVAPVADSVAFTQAGATTVNGQSGSLGFQVVLEDRTGLLAGENAPETVEIVLTNLAPGAMLTAAGGALAQLDATSWQFTGTAAHAATLAISNANLDGLDTINLAVTPLDGAARGTTLFTTTTHQQAAAAMTPFVDANDANGVTAGMPAALTIAAALTDTDGSESLSILLSGLPTNASLNQGSNLGGGVWELTPGQLSGLQLTTALGQTDFAITVQATALESANNATAMASDLLQVRMVA